MLSMLLSLIASLSIVIICNGYNVDVLSPLVVNSGLSPRQQRDYMFGFTLEYHNFSNGTKVLLVGAPRAEYNELSEGGVYVCPLRHLGECEMNTRFNLRNNSISNFNFYPLSNDGDDKAFQGQLLGFTIRSGGNYTMACAPLYIEFNEDKGGDVLTYFSNGRCVLMPRDFDEHSLVDQIHGGELLVGGVDAAIYKPNDINKELFAVGSVRNKGRAPVSGEVHVYTIQEMLGYILESYSSSSPNSIAGLQGYHIEKGHFHQDISLGREDLLVSAPKAEGHRGQILAYQTMSNGKLDVVESITGPSINSYFGYDFALVDLQTGGYHSVVVGCPLCDGERGEVYIYIHSGDFNDPIDEDNPPIILSSPAQQRVRFGTAVENIGDIDQDGYEDIAVSAPYMEKGVVYVYRGAPGGFNVDHCQIISAPDDDSTVGFGYVLTAAGFDVDDNYYPDFAIGDLNGRHIRTYRSSPVMDVSLSMAENVTLNILDRNCKVQNIPSVCFDLTPCFSFSTKYGGVDRFAVNYTLTVDELSTRVGLFNDTQTNRITNTIIINSAESRTCSSNYTFVLVPDFSRLDPIPVKLTVTNADQLLPLPSADSAEFGGELHPILSHTSDGSSLVQYIHSNYKQKCGGDNVCDPVFTVGVELDDNVVVIPWASGYEFSFTLELVNSHEDSLASSMIIILPKGIRLSRSESISRFAISPCESPAQQEVKCTLKNPIEVDEMVRFRVFFRPDVQNNTFDSQQLVFNFTVQDTVPRGTTSKTVPAKSVASYEVWSSFGVNMKQASRFVPSANTSATALTSQGPTINYQVSVRHTGTDDVSSPIPSLIINIVWPSVIILKGGERQPLLVPTSTVIIGSDSTTCREYGAIPSHLLGPHHQSPLVLPNITGNLSTEILHIPQHCPSNITCGVIQCEILNLSPQPRGNSTAFPPVQISIFSTLWSPSVRESINVSVYSSASSRTEYPEIEDGTVSTSTGLASIQLLPAVRETQRACFQLWIVIVSIVGGLMIAFFLVLVLGLCGCFGRGAYKKRKEEEQRERLRELHQTDGSLGAYVIPPPSVIYTHRGSLSKAALDKEVEDEFDAYTGENNGAVIPETFVPRPQATSRDDDDNGEITDETVMKLNVLQPPAAKEEQETDLETEI